MTRLTHVVRGVDPDEMTCRLIEAANQISRPPGAPPEFLLASLDEEQRAMWARIIQTAVQYVSERMNSDDVVTYEAGKVN